MANALERARNLVENDDGSVLFLGMDAPELPLDKLQRYRIHRTPSFVQPVTEDSPCCVFLPKHHVYKSFKMYDGLNH